ncbi:MAG: DUF1868 domain-containing protein [Leptolyngbya sp.]|nr:MAG: DUF1868 domain-containing protein [Leptolyngbya sp.]
MDENFQTYLNRAMRMTLPDAYRTQLQNTQESPKFELHPNQGFVPTNFPGYSIITPSKGDESPENQALYDLFEQSQTHLVNEFGATVFIPVPSASFHVTLADLIWDSAYRHAREDSAFEAQLQTQIAHIFQECQSISEGKPIPFQVLGLMLMPRSIGVCLAPIDEVSYGRILKFRRAIYQNHPLMGLGIEQQYYFTPHITLGYFGSVPSVEKHTQLSDRLVQLNQPWLGETPKVFKVHQAELYKFDDMSHYYREQDWATFKF